MYTVSLWALFVYSLFIFWLVAKNFYWYGEKAEELSENKKAVFALAAINALIYGDIIKKYNLVEINSINIVIGACIAAAFAHIAIETNKETRLRDERSKVKAEFINAAIEHVKKCREFADYAVLLFKKKQEVLEFQDFYNEEGRKYLENKDKINKFLTNSASTSFEILREGVKEEKEGLDDYYELLQKKQNDLEGVRIEALLKYNEMTRSYNYLMLNGKSYASHFINSEEIVKLNAFSERLENEMISYDDLREIGLSGAEESELREVLDEVNATHILDSLSFFYQSKQNSFEEDSEEYRRKTRSAFAGVIFLLTLIVWSSTNFYIF